MAFYYPSGSTKIVNSLDAINQCENFIKLNLMKTWNNPDEIDENMILFEPKDICVNSEGRIFILESNNIKIFDRNGKFIKKFGGAGGGPGDLWNPLQMEIDKKNRLIVMDTGNNRIQIFNIDGGYIGGFGLSDYPPSQISINDDNEVVMLNQALNKGETPLWIYYDMSGKIIRKEGIRKKTEFVYENKYKYDMAFSIGKENKVFKSFRYNPLIQIADDSDNIKKEIAYEVPFVVPQIKTFRRAEGLFVDMEMTCQSMAIDDSERIYLLAIDKQRGNDEKRIGYQIATIEKTINIKPKVNPEFADIYKILIFNSEGKVISSNKISKYANRIRVYKNTIYLIDTFVNMAIYEFKMTP
jgi:6-bladed beta-propeller